MSLTIRKLAVSDTATIERLVVEHTDDIEAGLAVLDSRLLVGQATIDVVACDANASLVLVAIGLVADEAMLLRAVEAYSWCLEYPETVRRLYPVAHISAERPPRMVFVVERVPDAFHRKIKQLGFSEVDLVEARYFDVAGTPAAFFDVVARLRRGVPPAPAVVPASATTTLLSMSADAPAPRRAPGVEPAPGTENVIPLTGASRSPSAKLQRVLTSDGDEASRRLAAVPTPAARQAEAPATVVSMLTRAVVDLAGGAPSTPHATGIVEELAAVAGSEPAAHEAAVSAIVSEAAATVTAAVPETEAAPTMAPAAVDLVIVPVAPPELEAARVSLREVAAALLEPAAPRATVGAASTTAADAEPERISFAGVANEVLGASAPQGLRLDSPAVATMPYPIDEDARTAIEELLDAAPTSSAVATPSPAEAAAPTAAAPKPVISTPSPVVEPKIAIKPAAPAAPGDTPAMPRLGVRPAVAPAVSVASPAPAAPPAAPATAGTASDQDRTVPPTLKREIAGLQFPNDGQLTRQWLEFLNQMAASK